MKLIIEIIVQSKGPSKLTIYVCPDEDSGILIVCVISGFSFRFCTLLSMRFCKVRNQPSLETFSISKKYIKHKIKFKKKIRPLKNEYKAINFP